MQTADVLGIRATAASMRELNGAITEAVAKGERRILANHNLHSLYLYHHDPKLREFYARAHFAHIDGMSLVLLARLLGFPLSREQRVTYVDWIRPLMSEALNAGWRVFFLGSRPGVGEAAAEALTHDCPGLQLSVHHGFFDMKPGSRDNQEVVETINRFRPQILMVGLGMPRQEHWILDQIDELDVNVVLPAGACMDYVAGAVPTPPRWMGRVGLEWLYRLASEPRRLAGRYLVEPWFIAGLLLQELLFRKFTGGRKQC